MERLERTRVAILLAMRGRREGKNIFIFIKQKVNQHIIIHYVFFDGGAAW